MKIFHPRTRPEPFHQQYLDALERELAILGRQYQDQPLKSVFLGGGTPSRLTPKELGRVIDTVHQNFELEACCEWSMELNPEDVNAAYVAELPFLGINRVSLGIQTFFDRSLQAVNRAHNQATAIRAVELLQGQIHNCSFDLMLGLPHQTSATLAEDLDWVARLGPQHLSVYMLERDLPTPLDKKSYRNAIPDEDSQAGWYEQVVARLLELGYEHYEISNFASPDKHSAHNLNYWLGGDYIAAGPAAHGRVGSVYWRNQEHLAAYVRAVNKTGSGQREQEIWSTERLRQERLIQGLRLAQGVPRNWLKETEWDQLADMRGHELIWWNDHRFGLTLRGNLLASEVMELFVRES